MLVDSVKKITPEDRIKIIHERLEGKIVNFEFLINFVDLKGVEKLKPHNVFSIVDFLIDLS